MGEFFAEVVNDPEKNGIIMVRGFKGKPLVEPYADMADISEIRGYFI